MAEKLKLTDLKRKAVIKAATVEFHSHGYEATSMDNIAKAAKVSKRTVYNHFVSKKALFDAICDELLNKVFEKDFLQYDPGKPLREQLCRILEQETALFLSEDLMNLARVVTSELIRNPSRANIFWEDVHKKKAETFSWLKDAANDGRLAIDCMETATRQLSGLMKEFIFWPQLFGGQKAPTKAEVTRIITATVNIFLSYYEVKK